MYLCACITWGLDNLASYVMIDICIEIRLGQAEHPGQIGHLFPGSRGSPGSHHRKPDNLVYLLKMANVYSKKDSDCLSILDVSHSQPQGAYRLIRNYKHPFCISTHSETDAYNL